jgi:hypothetical protein
MGRVTNAQGQITEYRTDDFEGEPPRHDIHLVAEAQAIYREFFSRDEDRLAHTSQQHWTQRLEWLFPLS